MDTKFYILLILSIGLVGCDRSSDEPNPAQSALPEGAYRSPMDVEFSPDGEMLAVSDQTAEGLITLATGWPSSLIATLLFGVTVGVVL